MYPELCKLRKIFRGGEIHPYARIQVPLLAGLLGTRGMGGQGWTQQFRRGYTMTGDPAEQGFNPVNPNTPAPSPVRRPLTQEGITEIAMPPRKTWQAQECVAGHSYPAE